MIEALWAGDWDLRDQPAHETELLADPCVHIVLEDRGAQRGCRLVGVWTRLWSRRLEGRGRVRGVKFKPGALRALVDRPAHVFTDAISPLADHLGSSADALFRAGIGQGSDAADFAAIEAWLLAQRRPDPRPEVGLAIAIMERVAQDRDITTVEQLCTVAGLSKRPLQRVFRDFVGAPPKWVIRRYRLQEAAVRLEADDLDNLAALADALGYTDQAHFSRDFKAATGRSPGRFWATMKVERQTDR